MDTAVVAATPSNRPMMSRSAIPQSVCKKYDNRYGSEKSSTFLRTLSFPKDVVIKTLDLFSGLKR